MFRHKSAARIAAQFAKRRSKIPINEVADDALALAKLGWHVRRAVEHKKLRQVKMYVKAAEVIAGRYGAKVVDLRDKHGAVMCLKFPKGVWKAGFRDLFFVA